MCCMGESEGVRARGGGVGPLARLGIPHSSHTHPTPICAWSRQVASEIFPSALRLIQDQEPDVRANAMRSMTQVRRV